MPQGATATSNKLEQVEMAELTEAVTPTLELDRKVFITSDYIYKSEDGD